MLIVLLTACATQERNTLVALGTEQAEEDERDSKSALYQTKTHAVPKGVRLLIQQAEQAIDDSAFELAQRKLERAQRLSPAYSRTYLIWGRLYVLSGQASKAKHMFKRALSLATTRAQRNEVMDALEGLQE